MDCDEGFPPHIIGFMRRKREREKLANEKLGAASRCRFRPLGRERLREAPRQDRCF
jgi:hypothetical protein